MACKLSVSALKLRPDRVSETQTADKSELFLFWLSHAHSVKVQACNALHLLDVQSCFSAWHLPVY